MKVTGAAVCQSINEFLSTLEYRPLSTIESTQLEVMKIFKCLK